MCFLQAHWWVILLVILTLSGVMGCTVVLCGQTLNTRDLDSPLTPALSNTTWWKQIKYTFKSLCRIVETPVDAFTSHHSLCSEMTSDITEHLLMLVWHLICLLVNTHLRCGKCSCQLWNGSVEFSSESLDTCDTSLQSPVSLQRLKRVYFCSGDHPAFHLSAN